MTSPEGHVQRNVLNLEDDEDEGNRRGSYESEDGSVNAEFNSSGSNAGPSSKLPVKAQVKPFTKESLDRLESKTVQLVREYGFQPRRKLSVEDGSVLPCKYEPFPSKLYGRPLEEIDNFIYDEVGGDVCMCFVS